MIELTNMKTGIKLLNQSLSKLEDKYHKVIGIYEQGSSVWGFADKNSDRDLVVLWENNYPDKKEREKRAKELGAIIHEFKDIPAVQKGIDMLEFENELLNVAHIKSDDLFNFYSDLNSLGPYYEEQLLRVAGFVYSKIHYDPEGKLEEYRKKIKLTEQIIKNVREKIKDELEYNLRLLKGVVGRGSAIRFVYLMADILNKLHIWYYMRKKKWLMSEKWFEAFSEKHGWEDEFVELVKDIKRGISMKELSQRLLKISASWGFKPSKKLKA